MWYLQDGCPAHSARIITELLNRKFGLNGQEITNMDRTFPRFNTYGFLFIGKVKTTSVQRNADNKRKHEGAYKKNLRCD